MTAANFVTGLRLVLAFLLFGLLSLVNQTSINTMEPVFYYTGFVVLGLFVLALLTDLLDGYIARKWNTESWFGRMADPLVDKVLICGCLVMLLGFPRLRVQELLREWMVVLVVSRELLIQGVRSGMEKLGIQFPAIMWGKLKMVLQSLSIILLLLYGLLEYSARWFDLLVSSFIWLMVLITVLSALVYLYQAVQKAISLERFPGV